MTKFGPDHRFRTNRRYLDGTRRFAYGHSYRRSKNEGLDPIGGVGSAPSLGSDMRPRAYVANTNYLWENAHKMYANESKNLY